MHSPSPTPLGPSKPNLPMTRREDNHRIAAPNAGTSPLFGDLNSTVWSFCGSWYLGLRTWAFQRVCLLVIGLGALSALDAATLTPPPAAPLSPQINLPAAPASEPPSELPKIVAKLAAQPDLSAADCASLARETLTYAQAERQSGKPLVPGIVRDGLAAVDRGEATDAKAADWPQLRSKLQELLKPPPPQDKPKEDEKKQDEKKKEEQQKKDQDQQSKDQKQDQQKSQDQEQKQSEQQQQQSQQEKQEQQKQEQEKKQQQAQPQQPDKPEPPKDTQSVGGEKPKDDERKEHPELAVPLQKLNQVRDKDSPAELFQLLQNDQPPPAGQPKKDW